MARREIPEINAGSMADIAFLLLIFFLVTTTMDTDSGIVRKLPPMPETDNNDDIEIKERNVFVVLVNRDNQLLVEGQLMQLNDLREAAKEFILNPNNDPNLPALEPITVDYFGTVNVTKKHVISLQNDRGTSFKTYISVQNELAAAYNDLRNELSLRQFGKKYVELDSEDEKEKEMIDAIEEVYPMKISEAEPKNVGG
ncbi:MAG: biopolymer transporter ExbD [Bacteroidota bacterium]|nr:MAG: biopolymer transporter ExbD [Bacteroidota bacterium]